MNVLITGASGMVGRALVEFGFSDISGSLVSRAADRISQSAQWIWRDRCAVLTKPVDWELPDLVVHLEVLQHIFTPSVSDLRRFREVNVEGTKEWLQWASRMGIKRFVYFSSIKAVAPRYEGPTSESAGPNRDGGYGESKWSAEQEVQRWAAEDNRRSALILRPAVIYGPGNEGNIGAMVRAIMRNRFFLVGACQNRKSVVSLRNVAAGCRHLVSRMMPGVCEVYNLVDRTSVTLREFDAIVRRAAGQSGNSPELPVPLAWGAAKFGDVIGRVSGATFPINSSRLRALREHSEFSGEKLIATGFLHPQTTEEGIAEMIASFGLRPR